jgi:hypothetical protein
MAGKRLHFIRSDQPLQLPPNEAIGAKANGKAHDRADSTEANGAADETDSKAQTSSESRSVIRVVAGELPRMVDEAQQALIASGLPIFARGGVLVHPILETVPASDGRNTITVKLRTVAPDLLVRWLAEAAKFVKYEMRRKKWLNTDPPRQVATTILAGADKWPFPRVACVATNPVLRLDGSLLAEFGYDAATQLYMVPDPRLSLPPLIERPSRDEALAAARPAGKTSHRLQIRLGDRSDRGAIASVHRRHACVGSGGATPPRPRLHFRHREELPC